MATTPLIPTLGATRSLEVTLRLDPAAATLARLWAEFPTKAPRAIMRALNAAGVTTRKIALKAVTTELNVRRKDVAGKNLKLYKATPAHPLETSVRIVGDLPTGVAGLKTRIGRIALSKFGPRQTRRSPGTSYAISPGVRKLVPHAFMARMPSGHVGVFIRTRWLGSLNPAAGVTFRGKRSGGAGRKREKFVELFGPSVPHVAQKSAELQRGFEIDVSDKFAKALASQLSLLLGGPRDAGAEGIIASAEASAE